MPDKEPVVIVADSIDYGRNDYMPLAVGNMWNYSWSTSLVERTPNGETQSSWGGTEEWEVVSYQKLNDTSGVFKLVVTGNKNSNIVRTETWNITRGTITLKGPDRIMPYFRTGTQATVSVWYSEGGTVAAYQATFTKGIGKTRESKREYVRVLNGLQREYSYLTILDSHSLKP
jgi:hypothetical protein